MWIISSWHGDLKGLSEDWESQKLGRGLWGTLRALGSSWFPKDTLSVLQKQQKQPGLDFFASSEPLLWPSSDISLCPCVSSAPGVSRPPDHGPTEDLDLLRAPPGRWEHLQEEMQRERQEIGRICTPWFPFLLLILRAPDFPSPESAEFLFFVFNFSIFGEVWAFVLWDRRYGNFEPAALGLGLFWVDFLHSRNKIHIFFPLPWDKVQVSQRINESRCGQVVYFKLMSWVTLDYMALFICCLDNLGCF